MASKNISFSKIPTSTRKPDVLVEWTLALAQRNLPVNRQRVVIIAQRTAPAAAAANPDTGKLYAVRDEVEVAVKSGYGSQAHLMARAAIKANPYADLSMITLADNAAGVAASGTITVAGTASSAGYVRMLLANAEPIDVAVSAAATAGNVAKAIADAVNLRQDLPVTAAAAAAVVTVTAKNKGVAGNFIRLDAQSFATGITPTVAAMSQGALNADITPALTAIAAEGHDIIVLACDDDANLLKLRDHLDMLASPMEKRWAIGIYGQNGSLATATTQSKRLNNGFMYNVWYRGTPSQPCELAAAFAAVTAGEEDPARPLNDLVLKGIGVCAPEQKALRTEQENALYNGVLPIHTGPDGTTAQIVRAVSTYTVSANGAADESLLDITTVRTLIYVSRALADYVKLKHPRDKMTGRVIKAVRNGIIGELMKMEDLEIIENVKENLPMLVVERDLQNNGMLNVRVPADVVNGLHVVGIGIDLLL